MAVGRGDVVVRGGEAIPPKAKKRPPKKATKQGQIHPLPFYFRRTHREGVPPDALLVQAEGDAERPDLVLEELAQGLDQLVGVMVNG